ncbi:hypothetical protein [Polyangium aurulentum]|uniref:hypothetical protein n=1 Tax=Polyangium aurulentum TaxID=2567896 RepID=UPI0010ADEBC9|nr:hypothetical protein [Polyangium aurulentum]UQA60700.1 hypothetical protein E8A73_009560 [Polyangium aurulentum]
MRLAAKTPVHVLVVSLAYLCGGCGMAGTIDANTRAIEQTTRAMGNMAGNLEAMKDLKAPMESVAGLRDPMEKVAALDGPMSEVAERLPAMTQLGEGMGRLEARMADMERSLESVRRPLLDVAALEKPMERVAGLDESLERVAGLEEPMKAVASLKRPMEDVSALRAPMEQLAGLGKDASSRGAGFAIGALAAWAFATFLGVYLGVAAANRRAMAPPRKARARGLSSCVKPRMTPRPDLELDQPVSPRLPWALRAAGASRAGRREE